MRTLAFVLLAAGFLWLVGLQLGSSMRVGVRPVVAAQYKLLDSEVSDKTYSKTEVETIVQETATYAYDAAPSSFTLPGLLMLLGGIMGCWRRKPAPSSEA